MTDDIHIAICEDTYCGDFDSIDDYFRSMLAEFIADPTGMWILDHLDMGAVRQKFEGNIYRFYAAGGKVYREDLE